MSSAINRTFVTRVVAVSAGLATVWIYGLQSMRNELGDTRAEFTSLRADLRAGADQMRDDQSDPVELIDELALRAERMGAEWERTGSSAKIYDLLFDLADQAGVRIEQITPRPQADRSVKPEADGPTLNIASVAYSVDCVGTFDGVTRFLRLIQTKAGDARVRSLRMTPIEGEGRVRAAVGTEHFAFREPFAHIKSPRFVSAFNAAREEAGR